ncbi:MAG TPA: hypothetical protein VFX21_04975 [Acidimicrobiia bacterium]|nr:hypothetical protein [Acidimicrobiia bacterium]
MPKSRNKYSRARMRERSRKSRHQRTSGWFYATVAVIVVIGSVTIGAIVMGRDDNNTAPVIGDHWHAAFGVNICGEWISNPATFETPANNSGVRAGIHTHGDGFIHIHPFARAETGNNATLGKFLSYGGWSASEDSISVWTGPDVDKSKTTWTNGDKCPSGSEEGAGEPGRVVFEVNCKTVEGNPSDHKLADQEVVAIGFVPKGVEIGAPPNAASAPENDSGTGTTPEAINQKECRPSAENNPGVPETVPPATTATTTPSTTSPTP